MTLRKRVSGIDETIRRPVVIEAQRIRCSLFVRVPAAKNGAETAGVSNPDRVSIQAHTSLFRAALARMTLRVSTFISRPDAGRGLALDGTCGSSVLRSSRGSRRRGGLRFYRDWLVDHSHGVGKTVQRLLAGDGKSVGATPDAIEPAVDVAL